MLALSRGSSMEGFNPILPNLEKCKRTLRGGFLRANNARLVLRFGCHAAAMFNDVACVRQGAPPDHLDRKEVILYHTLKLDSDLAGIVMDFLNPIKEEFPSLSTTDFYQLVAAVALESIGGPEVSFRTGRQLNESPTLEGGVLEVPKDGSVKHMIFNDKDVVALAGGLAQLNVGSHYRLRSEFMGSSSSNIITFSNYYYKGLLEREKEGHLEHLLDKNLLSDPVFRLHVEKYAEDEDTFFADYLEAHTKLSQLDLPTLKATGQTKSRKQALKSIGKKSLKYLAGAACFAAKLVEEEEDFI